MSFIRDRKHLAEAIYNMRFADLLQVAHELVEMNKDEEVDRNPDTDFGMAQTLADWAEAQSLDDD